MTPHQTIFRTISADFNQKIVYLYHVTGVNFISCLFSGVPSNVQSCNFYLGGKNEKKMNKSNNNEDKSTSVLLYFGG